MLGLKNVNLDFFFINICNSINFARNDELNVT